MAHELASTVGTQKKKKKKKASTVVIEDMVLYCSFLSIKISTSGTDRNKKKINKWYFKIQ